MKKGWFLIALIVGAVLIMTSPQKTWATSYYDEGHEFLITEIDIANNNVEVQRREGEYSAGRRLIHVNILWGPKWEEEMATIYHGQPSWSTIYLNIGAGWLPSSLNSGTKLSLRPWAEHNLKDNKFGVLIYSIDFLKGTYDTIQTYGKADYRRCLGVYREGVVCRAEQDAKGEYYYQAYLGEERLEMPELEDEETVGEGDKENKGDENQNGGANSSEPKTDGGKNQEIAVNLKMADSVAKNNSEVVVKNSESNNLGRNRGFTNVLALSNQEKSVEPEKGQKTCTESAKLKKEIERLKRAQRVEVPVLGGGKREPNWWVLVSVILAGIILVMLWWPKKQGRESISVL